MLLMSLLLGFLKQTADEQKPAEATDEFTVFLRLKSNISCNDNIDLRAKQRSAPTHLGTITDLISFID